MADPQALLRVLRRFARTMAGSYDITDALYGLSDSMVEVLEASAAGVALLEGEQLRFVTATSGAGSEAERAQERFQQGPCMTAIVERRPVAVADLREHHERWPEYCPAVEALGFRAVLGLPLVLDDRRIGSLDLYSVEPRGWSEAEIEMALVLADIGAAFVLHAGELAQRQQTAEQLQQALDTRVVIEQAKGVLAERLRISPGEAFERIRSSARRQSATVAEISRRVIETDYVPD